MKTVTIAQPRSTKLVIGVAFASCLALSGQVVADALYQQEWQPIATEKLVRLPASFMDKTLDHDFRNSPLAASISAVDTQIGMEASRMQALSSAIQEADGEHRIQLRHQFLQTKASYLELVKERQELDYAALQKKATSYQRVLQKLQRENGDSQDPVTRELLERQREARARLTATVARVDIAMLNDQPATPSKHGTEYARNLAKLGQLKTSIVRHVANAAPAIEGEEVSRIEYVQHLLAGIEAEKSLLNQEEVMLGYMARLVALDAQALEGELLAVTLPGETHSTRSNPARLANTTDLFIDQF